MGHLSQRYKRLQMRPITTKLPHRFPDTGDDLTGQKSAGRQPSSTSFVLKEEKDLAHE
jgi:hypothetical protein